MSVRALGSRLFKHALKNIFKRNLNTAKIPETINASQTQVTRTAQQVVPRNFALRNFGVQIGLQARRILIDNVLNRVTNSLAADLRKKALTGVLYGNSRPFFALVGVSLASGAGILTKEEELEGVCWEIRESMSKIQWHLFDVDLDRSRFENSPITLNDLSFGKPIAKGSNAVVYAVKIKNHTENVENTTLGNFNSEQINIVRNAQRTERESSDDITKFPLALKMMFNYDIQSNAMAILNAMYNETVPARSYYSNIGITDWELELANRNRHLPPHPNVVAIFSVFTDFVPELEDCRGLYPAALPRRLHPEGEGRNMSLFLLMKRYHCSLQNYVSTTQPSIRTSVLLLAQLLEGVAHLAAHGIAHRDLKADNLLLDTTEPDTPILVISDFGCCLADKSNGLTVPFTSYQVEKKGNPALMAPEIINQQPGTFSVLNYSKSDLWAAGAIAYEIFGQINPFYRESKKQLRNVDYKEDDLPDLPAEVPLVLKNLVKNILQRNPRKRLDPDVAANVCQLHLWAPSAWLRPGLAKLPASTEILQWLLSLTTKVLCKGRLNGTQVSITKENSNFGRRTYPEYLLIASFLGRAKLSSIRAALNWIQQNNDCDL